MAPLAPDAPESPAKAEEWLSVALAAARLGISTKTLRKRMARGEVAVRRVVLARGGAAYEVEMKVGLERSKPMFQTDASKFQTAFQTEGQTARNGSRFGSRNGTPSSVNRGGLEVEMETGLELSIPTSKPMPESSKPALEVEGEVARLRADLEREREGAAFLRGLVENHARAEAELRAALREALRAMPKALPAPSPVETPTAPDERARIAPERAPNIEVGTYGATALNGPQTGAKSLSYGDIADELERMMNR